MSVSSAVGSASEACLTTQMHPEVAATLTARVLAASSLWLRSLHCPALAAEHWASSLSLHIRKLQLQCIIMLLMYRETRRPRASLRSWRSSRVRALHTWSLPILQLPACSATQNVPLCNILGCECISLHGGPSLLKHLVRSGRCRAQFGRREKEEEEKEGRPGRCGERLGYITLLPGPRDVCCPPAVDRRNRAPAA